MKQLLLIALVLFVTNINGQKKDFYLEKNGSNILKVESQKFIAKVNFNSDTLEVMDFSIIKFIKIGDKVYKIESPTLTELKPTKPFLIGGCGSVTTDSATFCLPNRYLSTTLNGRRKS